MGRSMTGLRRAAVRSQPRPVRRSRPDELGDRPVLSQLAEVVRSRQPGAVTLLIDQAEEAEPAGIVGPDLVQGVDAALAKAGDTLR